MTYILCLISGILSALPMIYDSLFFLSWISLTPLFYVLITKTPKFRHTLVWSMGYYIPLYYWFCELYPMDFAGFTPVQSIGVIIFCWLGLSSLQGVGTAFLALLFKFIKGKIFWLYPISLACCFTLLEWAQTQTWMGVPFFRFALSQCGRLEMIQSASLFGSLFIGFIIALANGYFVLAFIKIKNEYKKPRIGINYYAAIAVSIIMVNFAYGYLSLLYENSIDENSNNNPVRIALIQGNISSGDKWNGSISETLDIYVNLTENAVQEYKPNIVLWPETVINVTLRKYNKLYDRIKQLATDNGIIIMTGTFDKIEDIENGEVKNYNAIMTFLADGTVYENPYYKRHPVPFGEYLPMSGLFNAILPVVANMNLFDSPIIAGKDSAITETSYGSIGGLVCFDSIYEMLAVDSVRDGAELIALVTNDSWYYDSAAVYQHNRHAMLRAVENGKYVIRAANTGISSIINPSGRIINSLKPLTTGYITGEVYFNNKTTFYTKTGNLIVLACFIFYIIKLAFILIENYKSGNFKKKNLSKTKKYKKNKKAVYFKNK